MRTYTGVRADSRVIVRTDGEPLCPRLDIHPLSQTGFDWGYAGSGPSQLALAILADHWPSDENRALRSYRLFMRHVIARIQCDRWELAGEEIDGLLANLTRIRRFAARPAEIGWETRRAG